MRRAYNSSVLASLKSRLGNLAQRLSKTVGQNMPRMSFIGFVVVIVLIIIKELYQYQRPFGLSKNWLLDSLQGQPHLYLTKMTEKVFQELEEVCA